MKAFKSDALLWRFTKGIRTRRESSPLIFCSLIPFKILYNPYNCAQQYIYLPTVSQRRSVKRKNRVISRCQSSVTEHWQLIYHARGPGFNSWKHHLSLLFFAVSKDSRQYWFRLSLYRTRSQSVFGP